MILYEKVILQAQFNPSALVLKTLKRVRKGAINMIRVAYLVDMNIAVIIFYSILGVYLIGLGVFVLTRKAKAKKNFEKEIKEHEEESTKKVDNIEK